jgi:O-antigen/teichoic acid export membrane protein
MFRRFQDKVIQLLRWSEKYTGTDMVYLAHGSFWLSGSSVITGAVSFGLALAFANLFSPHEYGTYKYALTLFGIFAITSLRGMDEAVTQAVSRGKDGTVVMGLAAKIRYGLIGSLGALFVATYYFYYGNTIVAWCMIVAAIFVPLMEPLGIFNAVLVGKRDFRLSSLLGIAGQIFSATALALALFISDNAIIIFIAYTTTWSLSRWLSLRYTLRKYPPNKEIEPGALSFALHNGLVGAVGILLSSLDSILVYHYLGAAELALYTFALAPVTQARALLNTPTALATPKLASQSTAVVGKVLKRRTIILFFIGIALTLGYCILAYPFYYLFFPNYIDAVPFSLVFSLTILMQVTTALLSSVVASRVTLIPKKLLYLWNLPSIVTALCAIFLIQHYGLWGAVIGAVLTHATTSLVYVVQWRAIRHKEHIT